jgi:hypothetical protein
MLGAGALEVRRRFAADENAAEVPITQAIRQHARVLRLSIISIK